MKRTTSGGPSSAHVPGDDREALVPSHDPYPRSELETALRPTEPIGRLTTTQLEEGLMRPRELAAALGISRSTLFAWVADGRIHPGIKLGRSVRAWPRAALPKIVAALSSQEGAHG